MSPAQTDVIPWSVKTRITANEIGKTKCEVYIWFDKLRIQSKAEYDGRLENSQVSMKILYCGISRIKQGKSLTKWCGT